MKITIDQDSLNIYRDEKSSPIYSIRKAELPHTIKGEGDNLSEWIMQLLEKTWITSELLYKVAVVIQSEFLSNDIDWKKTFFTVEKSNYLRHVKEIKEIGKNSNEKSLTFESVIEAIEMGVKEQNEYINEIVEKIVVKNLRYYGLNEL